ncbi:MAG: hypothetical protein ACYC27_20990 [Armatimonadota bacterium]
MISYVSVILIALAWIIPFWIGISHLRQGLRSGVTLLIMSALWGLGVIFITGAIITSDITIINHKLVMKAITWYGWIIPVFLSIICLRKRDKAGYALAGFGGLWAIFGLYMIGTSAYLAITGPPYTASIFAYPWSKQDQISLELKIKGHNGHDYSPWHFREVNDPPKVQIISTSGKLLWQETMYYG